MHALEIVRKFTNKQFIILYHSLERSQCRLPDAVRHLYCNLFQQRSHRRHQMTRQSPASQVLVDVTMTYVIVSRMSEVGDGPRAQLALIHGRPQTCNSNFNRKGGQPSDIQCFTIRQNAHHRA